MQLGSLLTQLWWITCALSNLYQILQLCGSYFEYPVTSEVRIVFEESMTLANVAVCFDLMEVINWTEFASQDSSKYRQIVQLLDKQLDETAQLTDGFVQTLVEKTRKADVWVKIGLAYILMNHTEVNKVFDYTYSQDKIISGVYCSADPTQMAAFLTLRQLAQIVAMQRYLLSHQMCYTLRLDKFEISTILQARDFIFTSLVYYLTFTPGVPSRSDSVTLYYIQEDRPRHGFDRSIRLTLGNRAFSTSHLQINRTLLQAPYETRCRNYTRWQDGKEIASSRAACHEECVFKQSLKLYKAVYPAVTLERRAGTVKLISPLGIDLKPSINTSLIETRCFALCRERDCDRTTYIATLSTYLNGQEGLVNNLPENPPIHIRTKPVMSWAYFATNICSSLSFWFALSLLDLWKLIKYAMCKRTASSRLRPAESRRPPERKNNRLDRLDRLRYTQASGINHIWGWYIVPTHNYSRESLFLSSYSSMRKKSFASTGLTR